MSVVIGVLWILLALFGVARTTESSSAGQGWSPAPTVSVQAAPAVPLPATVAGGSAAPAAPAPRAPEPAVEAPAP